MEPEELTFQEIKEITDGFAQELGHGSFGVVYKVSILFYFLPCFVFISKSFVNTSLVNTDVATKYATSLP